MRRNWAEFKTGRLLIGHLAGGKDVIASVEAFCRSADVPMAIFSVCGAVSSATIGCYDQDQRVYVTVTERRSFEILSCRGTVTFTNDQPFAEGRIILADTAGTLTGGRLFSPTPLFAGEITLVELLGPPLQRDYAADTGMMGWQL